MNPTPHELVLERIMNTTPAALWRCWTEPELLEQWFCPKPWYVTDVRMDLRPGGEMFCVMNGPAGERFEHTGVFLLIEPQARIVTTDAFVADWRPSARAFFVADTRFDALRDGRTRYLATARHWTAEACAEHEAMGFHEGWGAAAAQLEALAKTL